MGVGVDSIGGIPTFTKTMILIITFHGRFFLVLERKKRAPKKHQTHGWFYVMVRKSLLKIRVPWNKKPRYGTEPYMARLVSRGEGKIKLDSVCFNHFLGWKRSSFLPQNFKPNTVFPDREPWETLCSTKKQPSVTLHDSSAGSIHRKICQAAESRPENRFASPAALQDMLVSTRLTPSQRWTLLESSKRSCSFRSLEKTTTFTYLKPWWWFPSSVKISWLPVAENLRFIFSTAGVILRVC